jgi:hypothetical protein
MAVLIEAISVVIRAQSIATKYRGGWDTFTQKLPNATACSDEELIRVGFMTPTDAQSYVGKLIKRGLVYQLKGAAVDFAIVDQTQGLVGECDWLVVGKMGPPGREVATASLLVVTARGMAAPSDWECEGSLSQSSTTIPVDNTSEDLKFLRSEGGMDVFLNEHTGEEIYVGRTARK